MSGGEIVTLLVACLTAAGGVFATAMGNRARKYEADLEHEENEVGRLKEEVAKLREDMNELRDAVHTLKIANTRLWIAARLIEGQLVEAGIEPLADLEALNATT